jgi:hypothetical protein
MIASRDLPSRLQARRERLRNSREAYGLDYVKYCQRSSVNELRVVFLGTIPNWLKKDPAQGLVLSKIGGNDPIALSNPASVSKACEPDELIVEITPPNLPNHCDYQLSIKERPTRENDEPIPSLDPFFNSVTFKFDHHHPAPADCGSLTADRPSSLCPTDDESLPVDINYLAKDYASFRQLILDRLSVTMPDWKERCPADLGVMLVEILAYAADHLSYFQDAVANEAYLGTARLRTSLRRHARLVDYQLSEGCNARAWVHFDVGSELVLHPKKLFFLSFPNSAKDIGESPWTFEQLSEISRNPDCQVFEPVVSKPFTFYPQHNEIRLHDWGGATPCLPCGATEAYLIDAPAANSQLPNDQESQTNQKPKTPAHLLLKEGDVILFEERLSPWTGSPVNADPKHRHPVRITRVERGHIDRLVGNGLPLVRIEWGREDRLPFTLWISKPPQADWPNQETPNQPLAVALGNMLLVDHGQQVRSDAKVGVNVDRFPYPPDGAGMRNYPRPRVRGELAAADLTFACPLPRSRASAAEQLRFSPRHAVPQVVLRPNRSPDSLLKDFSIHELQDPVRLAKRLFAQALDELKNPTTDRTSATESSLCPAESAIQAQLQALQQCQGIQAGDDRDAILGMTRLRDALRQSLRDIWLAAPDLFDCDPDDARFVVEMTDERIAQLRFGGDGFGRMPELSDEPNKDEMIAHYRIGNGTVGNVAAETIRAFGTYDNARPNVTAVRNPLPATGGRDPEGATTARLFAPQSIRSELRRACVPSDYDKIAMSEFGDYLQAVRTTFRWTGHEMSAMVAVDPLGDCLPSEILQRIGVKLSRYRRIGHSVRVFRAKRMTPVLKMKVMIPCHVSRSTVESMLHQLFSSRTMPNGELGYFHPDRSTFGDGIIVSDLIAVACRHLGENALSVEVTALHRRESGPGSELIDGILKLKPLEIIRFDNNPRSPRFGRLEIDPVGGR